MPFFDNEGVKIYYEIEGKGPDLIMIHGFASNIDNNWRNTNWIKTLKDDNRLILMDCRGHGKSDKPTDPAQYGGKMVGDIVALMDHLSIVKANFFGYSMGSQLTFYLLILDPQRVKCAVLGGFVIPPPRDKQETSRVDTIASALKAESIDQIKSPIAREFRRFAESTGGDLKALAAVMIGNSLETVKELASEATIKAMLKKISVPILTVVGSDDFLLGDKTLIAKSIRGACHFQIQGKDHLTVVPDPRFHIVVKAFLNYMNRK